MGKAKDLADDMVGFFKDRGLIGGKKPENQSSLNIGADIIEIPKEQNPEK